MASRPFFALVVVIALVAGACGASVDVSVSPRPTPSSGPADSSGTDSTVTGDEGDGDVATPETDAGASADSSQNTGALERTTWNEAGCAFDEPAGVTTTCGWLTVPEHWDDPDDSDVLRLHVGIFSTGDQGSEPVVYLEGGPGGDALANIGQSFDVLFGQLVEEHDIVILGQRGTGSADPTLKCSAATEVDFELLERPTTEQQELALYSDAYAACAADFRADRIDPRAYNSVENAHDVDALRQVLGFETWNLLGISYGTRLAQSVMRLHPEGVRAAVLDSVLATEREPNVDIPKVANRAFDELFAGCGGSEQCNGLYPDLESRFFALVDELDQTPMAYSVVDVATGEQYSAILDGTGLMEMTFSALYSKAAFAALPELVGQVEQGDTSGVATLMTQEIAAWESIADGMYWSVQCNEEIPFLDAQAVVEGRGTDPRYDRLTPRGTLAFFDSVCASLDAGVAPAVEDDLVVSDVPSLLLAGSYDPITPPSDTQSLAAGLTTSVYVELEHTGHAVLVDPCAQQIVIRFLATPAANPDVSCVPEVAEPDWVPDLFSALEFEAFDYSAAFVSGTGVAPVGWDQSLPGTFVNSENFLHLSVIVQQAVEDLSSEFLVQNMLGILGEEATTEADEVVGGDTWSHHRIDIPGSIVDMFTRDDGDGALLVLFQHAPSDREAALLALTQPILAAFGP
ncbi:MAG: alpha/beta hydrolase [Acidimicrobiales bacterium]